MGLFKDILAEGEIYDKKEHRGWQDAEGVKLFIQSQCEEYMKGLSIYHMPNNTFFGKLPVEYFNSTNIYKMRDRGHKSLYYSSLPSEYLYIDLGKNDFIRSINLKMECDINTFTDGVLKDMPYTDTEGELWDYEYNGFNRFLSNGRNLYSSKGNKILNLTNAQKNQLRMLLSNTDFENKEEWQGIITKFVQDNRNSLTIQPCNDKNNTTPDYWKVAFAFIEIDGMLPARLNPGKVSARRQAVTVKGGKIYTGEGTEEHEQEITIDHINQNRFDNSAENLEIMTQSQNSLNSRKAKCSRIIVTNHGQEGIYCQLIYENNKTAVACYTDENCQNRISNDCITSEVIECNELPPKDERITAPQLCGANGGKCELYMVPIQYMAPGAHRAVYFKSIQSAAANISFHIDGNDSQWDPSELVKHIGFASKSKYNDGGYIDYLHFQEPYSNIGLENLNTVNEGADYNNRLAHDRIVANSLNTLYGNQSSYKIDLMTIQELYQRIDELLQNGKQAFVRKPRGEGAPGYILIEIYDEASRIAKQNYENIAYNFNGAERWYRASILKVDTNSHISYKDIKNKNLARINHDANPLDKNKIYNWRPDIIYTREGIDTKNGYEVLCSTLGRIVFRGSGSEASSYKLKGVDSNLSAYPKMTSNYDIAFNNKLCHIIMASTFKQESLKQAVDQYRLGAYNRNDNALFFVHHKDANMNNFSPDNLEWVTSRENSAFDRRLYGIGLFELFNGEEYPVAAFANGALDINKAGSTSDRAFGLMTGNEDDANALYAYKDKNMELHLHIKYHSHFLDSDEVFDKSIGVDGNELSNILQSTSYFQLGDISQLNNKPVLVLRWVRFKDFRIQGVNNRNNTQMLSQNLASQIIGYMHKETDYYVRDVNGKPIQQINADNLRDALIEYASIYKKMQGQCSLEVLPRKESGMLMTFNDENGNPITAQMKIANDFADALGLNVMDNTGMDVAPDKVLGTRGPRKKQVSESIGKMQSLMKRMK